MADRITDRNASLDWLRVISIIYVTGFWHLLNYSDAWPQYHAPFFWRVTVLALGLFTLISGYLMGRGTVPSDRKALADFYVRRLTRIYPPYLFALLLYVVLRLTGRITILKGALLLGMLVPPPPPTLWFVGMILLCYIATPWLMRLAASPMRTVSAVAVVVITLWIIHAVTGLIDPRLPLYIPAYAAGVVFARYEPLRVSKTRYAGLIGATAIAAIVSLPAKYPPDMSFWMAPYALLASITVFLLCNHRLPENRIIARLSYGSFFLYLLHRPIYEVVTKFTGTEHGKTNLGWLLLMAFPFAIVAGYGGQFLYDKVVMRVTHRNRIKRANAPAVKQDTL